MQGITAVMLIAVLISGSRTSGGPVPVPAWGVADCAGRPGGSMFTVSATVVVTLVIAIVAVVVAVVTSFTARTVVGMLGVVVWTLRWHHRGSASAPGDRANTATFMMICFIVAGGRRVVAIALIRWPPHTHG